MKKLNLKLCILMLIVVLAAVLRLWNLTSYPDGLNADEASLGYNAYSLLQTGKDEYGTPFPLTFKSFGDYKPGLYVYFVMPFVAVLGLNEWAVRLPSALLGVGTVLLVYFLARKIFKSEAVGLVSAFILATSPWHIHFSRGGWETNAATFFITLGVLLFIKGLEKTIYFLPSFISFLAALYLYQSTRLVAPALVLSLCILYWQPLLKNAKALSKIIFVCLILSIPFILQFTSGHGAARFTGLSIFSDPGPASRTNQLVGEHTGSHLAARLLHNKLTAYGPSFLGHYLDHFSGSFLFINGDPLIRNKVPETGEFYLIESLFLLLGVIYVFRQKIGYLNILIAWILAAPLASALTYQTPSALRAESMVVPLSLIIGYGLYKSVIWFKGYYRVVIILLTCLGFIYEGTHYLESYYVHYPKRYPLSWEYGFKEMVSKLQTYQNSFDKVVITDRYDQPYILVLFYEQYDPAKYQPQAHLSERDKFNFGTVRSLDKYEFHSITSQEVQKSHSTLFIGTTQETPSNAKIIDKVDFPNGDPAFIFFKT